MFFFYLRKLKQYFIFTINIFEKLNETSEAPEYGSVTLKN